jgi:hypothetical protein
MQLLLDGIGSVVSVDNKVLGNIRYVATRLSSVDTRNADCKLRKDLQVRIEAIKWVEAQKKGQAEPNTALVSDSVVPSQTLGPPNAGLPIIPSAFAGPSFSQLPQNIPLAPSSAPAPKASTSPMAINMDNDFPLEPQTHVQDSDSDEELWYSFGDMPAAVFDTITKVPPVHSPTTSSKSSSKVNMEEIQRQLRAVFGLTDFRPNQLEAITATLEGKDVFVLMPTGGGKSLCYQLPAVCTTGDTCGVTIVVSPLTALMEDQVSALTAKGVDAFLWNAESVQQEVAAKLFSGDKKPSLLYVTPEKLRASGACRNLLNGLYQQQQLARFAIDEAHCISTWGQDFRSAVSEG